MAVGRLRTVKKIQERERERIFRKMLSKCVPFIYRKQFSSPEIN